MQIRHPFDTKSIPLDENSNLTRGLRDFAFRKCIKDIRTEEEVAGDRDTTATHSVHVSRAVRKSLVHRALRRFLVDTGYFVDLCETKGTAVEIKEVNSLILDLAKRIARIHIKKIRGYLQIAHKRCQLCLKRANRCHESITVEWDSELWLELASQLKLWQHLFLTEIDRLRGSVIGRLVVRLNNTKMEIELIDPAGSGATVNQQFAKALSDTFSRPWDCNRRLIRTRFGEELDRLSPKAKRRILAMVDRPKMGDLLGSTPSDMVRAARHLTACFGPVLRGEQR